MPDGSLRRVPYTNRDMSSRMRNGFIFPGGSKKWKK
jgi:hypothetical protein